MAKQGTTILEATEQWVNEFYAYPLAMIEMIYSRPYDSFQEVTAPVEGDKVYVYDCNGYGTIHDIMDFHEYLIYVVEMDEGTTGFIECKSGDFEVVVDYDLPMWGTMWSFGDSADDYWLEEMGGIDLISRCGFRIYESEEFGYFFGIDGAGYDFYESHFVPLYKVRGLQWHDPMTESGSFVMKEWRKADLYDGLLGYLSEMISDKSELVSVLKKIGFSDQEIAFEGLEVIGDAED